MRRHAEQFNGCEAEKRLCFNGSSVILACVLPVSANVFKFGFVQSPYTI